MASGVDPAKTSSRLTCTHRASGWFFPDPDRFELKLFLLRMVVSPSEVFPGHSTGF